MLHFTITCYLLINNACAVTLFESWQTTQRVSRGEIRRVTSDIDGEVIYNSRNQRKRFEYKIWWNGPDQVRGDLVDLDKSTRHVCCSGFDGSDRCLSGVDKPVNASVQLRELGQFESRELFTLGDPRFIGFSCDCTLWLNPLGDRINFFHHSGLLRNLILVAEPTPGGGSRLALVATNRALGGKTTVFFDKDFTKLLEHGFSSRNSRSVSYYYYNIDMPDMPAGVHIPSSIRSETTSNGVKIRSSEVYIRNFNASLLIEPTIFTLKGISFPEGKAFAVMGKDSRKEYYTQNNFQLKGTKTKAAAKDLSTNSISNPPPQAVESDGSDRLYYFVAAGILLAGAIGIALLLLRRKANPT